MHADSDRLLATVEQVLKAGELGQRARQQNRASSISSPSSPSASLSPSTATTSHPTAITLAPFPAQSGCASAASPKTCAPRSSTSSTTPSNTAARRNGSLHIRCTLAITDYRFVSLAITDHGLGIPEAELKRIFKRFYRIPGRYEVKIKGTGLGLFLVRTIARQHGGSVTAASAGAHHGTTMTLTLPLAMLG